MIWNNINEEEEPFVPTAEDTEKVKRALVVFDRLKDATRHCLVAIAGIVSDDEGTFEGTGTIIELGGEVLLATAEHVISKIESSGFQGVAYSSGDKKLYSRAPEFFKKNAAIDVAFARIRRPMQPESDRAPCPERLIAKSAEGVERDLLFIHGFPGRYSQFFRMTDGIHSKTLPFGSGPGTPKWSKFDPAIHFAISYDPKYNQGMDGKPVELPDPHGLSGVAVWNTRRAEVGTNWTPDDARIAGMIQQWDQDGQCLIATRIEHILQFLRSR
jgi:hypothetical protein